MMSQWVLSKFRGRWLVLFAALATTALGCTSDGEGSRFVECLQPSEDENLDALLAQRERAGKREVEFAAEFMRLAEKDEARATALRKHWGGAAKSYATAAACYPTVEALVGYAYADAMMDISQPTPRETWETKLRIMRRAVSTFRLAQELSKYTGEPVPSHVPAKIECIEAFLADPDPNRPPCKFVGDALQTSGLGGA